MWKNAPSHNAEVMLQKFLGLNTEADDIQTLIKSSFLSTW